MWMLLDPTSMAARRKDSRLSCLWDKRDEEAVNVMAGEYTIKSGPERKDHSRPTKANMFLTIGFRQRNPQKRLCQAVGKNVEPDVPDCIAIVLPHEQSFRVGDVHPSNCIVLVVQNYRLLARDHGAKWDAVPHRIGGCDVKHADVVEPVELGRRQTRFFLDFP
jgi:hypothetical protein